MVTTETQATARLRSSRLIAVRYLALGGALCLILITAIIYVEGKGARLLLFAAFDGRAIGFTLAMLAMVLLSTALTLGDTSPTGAGVPFSWLGVILFAPAALLMNADVNFTSIDTTGRGPDIVVREESFLFAMRGDVYERHGIILTTVGNVRTDDGYQPFSSGAYDVDRIGDELHLRYSFDRASPSFDSEVVVTSR